MGGAAHRTFGPTAASFLRPKSATLGAVADRPSKEHRIKGVRDLLGALACAAISVGVAVADAGAQRCHGSTRRVHRRSSPTF